MHDGEILQMSGNRLLSTVQPSVIWQPLDAMTHEHTEGIVKESPMAPRRPKSINAVAQIQVGQPCFPETLATRQCFESATECN